MSENLLEKYEPVVVEMAHDYLDNMEIELGKKYKNNDYEIHVDVTDDQYVNLMKKHDIPTGEFAELYAEFQKMRPGKHLMGVMGAFTASGGGVEVEPIYDEETKRLNVSVNFVMGDKTMDKIEGLSEIEHLLLKMDAIRQINTVLSGSDASMAPEF